MLVRPLSPELQVKAGTDLYEVPSRIQADLNHIRQWLAEQPHLHARTDDQWLLGFLRGCKYDLDRTKAKLDLFYTMRGTTPELFENRDPLSPVIQELLEFGTCVPLPKGSDPTASTTIIIRHKSEYREKVSIMDVVKIIMMTIDILINEDDNFNVAGITSISELKGISLKHMFQVTPGRAKTIMTCFQSAYPVRPQQVHFLNAFGAFDTILKIVKVFMTQKLRNRIYIYSERHVSELPNAVSPDVLPEEYGGNAGPLSDMITEWKTKVESYRDWFLEDAKYHSDESKRPRRHYKLTETFNSILSRMTNSVKVEV